MPKLKKHSNKLLGMDWTMLVFLVIAFIIGFFLGTQYMTSSVSSGKQMEKASQVDTSG